jgi:hypothetical protein
VFAVLLMRKDGEKYEQGENADGNGTGLLPRAGRKKKKGNREWYKKSTVHGSQQKSSKD